MYFISTICYNKYNGLNTDEAIEVNKMMHKLLSYNIENNYTHLYTQFAKNKFASIDVKEIIQVYMDDKFYLYFIYNEKWHLAEMEKPIEALPIYIGFHIDSLFIIVTYDYYYTNATDNDRSHTAAPLLEGLLRFSRIKQMYEVDVHKLLTNHVCKMSIYDIMHNKYSL